MRSGYLPINSGRKGASDEGVLEDRAERAGRKHLDADDEREHGLWPWETGAAKVKGLGTLGTLDKRFLLYT